MNQQETRLLRRKLEHAQKDTAAQIRPAAPAHMKNLLRALAKAAWKRVSSWARFDNSLICTQRAATRCRRESSAGTFELFTELKLPVFCSVVAKKPLAEDIGSLVQA